MSAAPPLPALPGDAESRRIRAAARRAGRLRELPGVAPAVGLGLLGRAALPWLAPERRMRDVLTAARWVQGGAGRTALLAGAVRRAGVLERGEALRRGRVGWQRYASSDFDGQRRELSASLVLKEPGPGGELGVLYAAFEYNWMRLLANYDVRALLQEYLLVGATSWSPTDYLHLANFAGLSKHPVFPGISHPDDVAAYEVLAPAVRPLPLMASDWVHPAFYAPRPPAERDIDLLMVANFSRFKRHWLLFEALRALPRGLRVVLVGQPAPGRSPDVLRREAAAFGAPQDLEIIPNAPMTTVTALQEAARVSLIFSRREGACVAVVESLFAGSPVAMLADAHIGSRAYINPRTGALLPYANLARELAALLERHAEFDAAGWAREHIGCERASDRLNATLRAYSESAGRPWTRDVMPLCWRPRPVHYRPEDEAPAAAARERLARDHGVAILPPPGGRWVLDLPQAAAADAAAAAS